MHTWYIARYPIVHRRLLLFFSTCSSMLTCPKTAFMSLMFAVGSRGMCGQGKDREKAWEGHVAVREHGEMKRTHKKMLQVR
jgi:hypothetical protein